MTCTRVSTVGVKSIDSLNMDGFLDLHFCYNTVVEPWKMLVEVSVGRQALRAKHPVLSNKFGFTIAVLVSFNCQLGTN